MTLTTPFDIITPDVLQPVASIAVGPWNGQPQQEVVEFSQMQLSLTLNDGHQLSFSMPGRSQAALLSSGLATDVWLTLDADLTGRFRMLPLNQSWDGDGQDTVTVTAVSYKRLLAWRFLHSNLSYPVTTEQGEILWGLISHTQAQSGGGLGITKGNVATGVQRGRDYKTGDNILDLGQNISGVINGCWWDVDENRILTAKQYTSFPTQTVPVQLGTNALAMVRSATTAFANGVMASGSDEQTVPVWVATTDVASDPRGRWEATTSSPSTVIQATVTEQAQGYLSWTSRPPNSWQIELSPHRWRTDSRFKPGDKITVILPRTTSDPVGTPVTSVQCQVTEVSADFNEDGDFGVQIAAVEGIAGGAMVTES